MLLTTDVLPPNYEIAEMFSMVQITKTIEVSSKGLIRGFLERNRNEYQEALDYLAECSPAEANAIIGIKATSSTQQFNNGTFMYLTYIGTPIIYKSSQSH